MTTATTSGLGHTIKRIRRVWSELDYAQRRLLEIRTGQDLTDPHERGSHTASVEQLEAQYDLEAPRHAA